jgi:flagellar motility protein MotE (MotC chaperone)
MVLPLLAGLLILSGLIRAGGGVGLAIAEGALAHPETMAGDAVPEVTGPAALMAALQEREARVTANEAALADRAQALNVAEAEIREQLEALAAAEASLVATLALADSAAEDDLTRLTAVYENMKPQDTAALFATMDPAFAAGFLGRMRPDAAAAVMTNLAPDVAYSISVLLAGRNAAVPTE